MANTKTVLAYHSVGECPIKEVGADLYTVPLDRFRRQMAHVRQHPNVIVTFDDGDMTNYMNAFPVLKEMGLKAYFFIIGTKIGTPGYMNWNEIKALRDAGMIIGSHGMTHRILTELSDKELDYELNVSKNLLEARLKAVIDVISIPRGFCDERVMITARMAGYKTMFTSDNRIVVRSDWDLAHFKKVLNNSYLLCDKVEGLIKNMSRRMLGANNYDRIRTMILRSTPNSQQPKA